MSKSNINLPKTAFSMKANLQNKEPGIIDYWDKIDLYKKLRSSNKGKKNLFFMMALHMQMEIYTWVRLLIKFLKI